jgi:hypothetical protein
MTLTLLLFAFFAYAIIRAGAEAERQAREPYTPSARHVRRLRRKWMRERMDINPAMRRR